MIVDSSVLTSRCGRKSGSGVVSGIVIEPVDEAQARIARAAYRDYALAREKGEPLLYKGTDFGHTGLPTVMAE